MNTPMKNPGALLFISLTLVLLSCGFSNSPRLKGDDPTKDERKVDTFSKIGIGISADVWYTQETTQKLVLVGAAKDLEKITTEVRDGKLKIGTKSGFHGSIDKVKIYISTALLQEIGLSGSGNFYAEGPVSAEAMRIAVSGSGDIAFKDLKAGSVEVALSGSGDISLAGKKLAGKVSLAISGSGDIDTEKFTADEVEIAISGSGDCRVHAEKTLHCAISGSGDVGYSGKPVVNAKISGSGKVQSL